MDHYFYSLPKHLIAQVPAEPRDSARLFIYKTSTDEIFFDTFSNCVNYFPSESILILNKTRVVPARVFMKKETGGKIEVLFLVNEYKGGDNIQCIVDRKISIGNILFFENDEKGFLVVDQKDQLFTLRQLFDGEIVSKLETFGTTPIPKYIQEHFFSEEVLRKRYQSIFAEVPSSVAAPTASLHFTDAVFDSFKGKNIITKNILLHVGMGTFAPVTNNNLKDGRLHTEYYHIPQDTIESINGGIKRPIIAVGTTTVRALESFGSTKNSDGETSLFIRKPFHFSFVSGLVTNFHVPGSSLMYLVDAFLDYKGAKRSILDLYSIAIENEFRFYSFGDAMLIL